MFIEPLEDRRVLAVTSVFNAGTGALALTFDGLNNDAITIQSQSTGTSDFHVNAAAGTTLDGTAGNSESFTGVTSITVNGNTASANSLTFDTNDQTNSVSGAISITDIDAVLLNDSNAAPTGTLTAGSFSESGGTNATTTLDRPLFTTGAAGVSITGDKNITANSTLDASAAATGTITLSADNNITVDSGASIKTAGGVSLTAASLNVNAGASVSSSGNNITIAADQMTIQGAIDAGSHIVALQPKTTNTAIDLGGPDAAGTLGLTNAELAEVTAGILRIGSTSGVNSNITLSSSITDVGAAWNTLSLLTNNGVSGIISQNSGASLTVSSLYVFASQNVNLTDPGNAVSQISGIASGHISFVDSTSLTVGDVEPTIGFAGLGSLYSGTVSLTLLGTGDLLTVSNAIDMTRVGNSGDVVLSADDMAINAAIKALGKAVTLQQGSILSRDIDLGGGATAGELGISDAELSEITASSVTIGRSDNPGKIVITAPVTTHAGYSDLVLKSGGDISVNYGLTTSGNLSLNAAGTTSIAASVSASAMPTVTGGSLFVDYANGASLPLGLAFTSSTSGATLTVSDLGDTTAHTYDLTSASFTRDGAAPINYSGIASFVLDGGDGNDTINVSGPLSAAVSILGGSQTTADVLNYDAGGNSVVLTANSITAGAGQTLTFSNIEDVNVTDVAGVTVNGDGTANNLVLTRTGAATDAYQLDGGPVVSLDGASSFSFAGAGGADHMQINETASGLPQFGGTAAGSHTNSAFAASGQTPTNLSVNFSGGGNAGDSLGISFLNSQNVTYFDDNVAAGHSGVVNVAGQFTLSFNGLAPVNFTGAGGTLTVNTLSDPLNNSLTVADDGTPGDGVSQITGNGGFETTTFSGFSNLVAQGLNALTGETITLAGLDSATSLSNVTLQGGAGGDIITVRSLPASVAAALLGGGGANNFVLDNATHNLQQIAGPVVVSPAGDIGGAGDSLMINDSGDAASRTVQVTSSTIEGITGDAGAPDITYGAGSQMTSVSILGGSGGNTFNVQSTRAGTTYFVNSGAGDDTVNVSSTAPAVNGNGTLTGNLNGIQGELDIASGAGTDTLNVSDYGGGGRNYTLVSPGAGVTQLSATGIASIVYNSTGGSTLEHFNLVGAAVGGNTYNILNTTATLSTVVSDGDASASGNSTFNIQANQLQAGASNSFNGFAGDDLFNLNFAAATSVPSAAGTTLAIDGGGLATGNDRVNVNANLGVASRTVGLNYQSNSTSDVQITGLGAAAGAIGVVGARQINYYGDAANNDTVSVSGAASGNNTLSVTPLSASSANVFLGGNPLLTIPPGSTGSNNPGVLGGGAGPDLYIGGVALAGFSVNGGSIGAGNGNRLVVNGKSENLNGAGGTSAWGGNAFGSPSDTVAAGNGYDQIDVSDSKVSIVNNAVGALLAVNYTTNSFANPSPTQSAVTVNGGDETTPAAGVADDFTVHLSSAIHFQINGGAPPAGSAPNGDRLNVLTPNDAEIWSDAATPPNVSVTSSGSLPVSYNSIEELSLTPGNGIVNIYGDNNVSGGAQNDGYRVVGTGPNAFTLQITGDKNNPASYSNPIQISGVTTLNAYGEAKGVDNTGNDINALYVTPWANNTPQGWGVQTFWDQGDKNHDGDLLVYNGVSGVSENINVQPSASEAGQLFSTNAATGTPIAVINYTLNANIIVNGNDGSAGDTDTLTLNGTDPANPGASGNDSFVANFAATGTPADPMVVVTDKVGGAALYTLQSLSNVNTVNVNMQGGSDSFELVSGRNNGSLTLNVDAGAPSGPGAPLTTDTVQVDGTAGADSFTVSPGASNDAGRVAVQLAGATVPTVLNFTAVENLALDGGGSGPDSVTLLGSGSNDSFALSSGAAQVNSNAPIALTNFSAGSTVNVVGGLAGNGSATIIGTPSDDAFAFMPTSPTGAVVNVGGMTYNLSGLDRLSVDGAGGANNTLSVSPTSAIVTPGSTSDSGTVTAVDASGNALLPLSYSHIASATVTGGTLVIDSSDDNTTVTVAANGDVTVANSQLGTNVYHAAGYNALAINVSGDNSQVNIAASTNFSGGIQVFCDNDGSGNTTLNFTGDGAGAVTVDLALQSATEAGFAPVSFKGVATLNVNAGNNLLAILGTAGPDQFSYTPTAANAGSVTWSGATPTINVSNVSSFRLDPLGGVDSVIVNATSGHDNTNIVLGSTTTVNVVGLLPVFLPLTNADSLNVEGNNGDDNFFVFNGGGPNNLQIDGGAGSNLLQLTGDVNVADDYSYVPGATGDAGSVNMIVGGNSAKVNFTGIQNLNINAGGGTAGDNVDLDGTGGNDVFTLFGTGPGAAAAQVNNGPHIQISGIGTGAPGSPGILQLRGLEGADTFNITHASNWQLQQLIIIGGASGGSTVNLNGTSGNDNFIYTPTSQNSGEVQVTAGGWTTPDSLDNISNVTINGQQGTNSMLVSTAVIGMSSNSVVTPGSTPGTGDFSVRDLAGNALLPMSYSNIQNLTGIGGIAEIVGSGANDTVTVSSAGIVTVTNDLGNSNSIDVHNYNSLVINLEGGQNSVTFLGDNPAMFPGGVKIIGSGNDTVTAPVGAASSLDLATNSVTGVFGGAISTSGVANLVLNGANGVANAFQVLNYGVASDLSSITLDGGDTDNNDGDTVRVSMAAGGNRVNFTPESISSASLSLASGGPTLNIANFNNAAGSLSLTSTIGLKSLNVVGSSASDAIELTNLGAIQRVVQTTGVAWVPLDFSGFGAVSVQGGAGDDTLTVDSSTNPFLAPITYDGGAGSNSLTLTGGSATSDTYSPGPGAGQGLSTIVFGAGTQTVHFSNLSPVIDTIVSPLLTVNGTNGDDAINYSGDAANPGNGLVSVNNLETISFLNKTTLAINGGAGSDTINLNNPNTPTGLTAINVVGGDPTSGSDTLIVNGTTGTDAINFIPTSANSGSLTGLGPVVNITTVEQLVVNGQGGDDALTVTTPLGGAEIGYVPGATRDAGSVSLYGFLSTAALLPVDFSGLGSFGNVTFANAGGGRSDGLDIHGTSSDDRFDVSSAGTVHVVKPTFSLDVTLPINTPGVTLLRLIGEAGDDIFNIPGNTPFSAGINVQGGDPSASDTLNFTGSGAGAVTVDLTAQTITEAGFASVSFTGVEHVNVNAAGQPVIVNDNSGPNTLEVTPTGANSALLQVQGASSVFNVTNAGSLALGFIPANNNQLVVNATPNADTINVSGASVSIVGLLAVNETGVASLTVNGLEGSDTFNVTAAAIPIHINGGDPIGVLPGDTLNILAGGNPVQFFAGPHVDEGGFVIGANAEISYQQIESIGAIINPGPVLIVGTNGDDDIQVTARDASYITSGPVPPGLDGTQDFTVSVNQGPNILFVNATQGLFIDALSGDDQVDVRAPAPNNAPWNMQVTVAGGAPAGQPGLNGDDFTFETPGAGNHVTYQATGIDTGVFALTQTAGGADSTVIALNSFTIPAPPLAKPYVSSAGGFESLAYDGQGVNDVLAIAGTAGNDTITSTPGAANDAGTIAVNSLLALSYKNLGAGGSLTVGGNGGVDTLVVNGTAGVDSFGVNSAGTVSLNGRTPIQQLGITNLVLNGLGGDNTYSISALQPYSHTTVNGSGNSDPDVLNLAGDGSSPVSVNLGGPTQTVSGGGLGVVDITGVGIVNLSNAAGAINVLGTTGPDSLSVTPTGANTVTIQDGALAPVLNTTNTGALNIVEGTAGDGDTVTVHGTSNSDVIGVAQGATTTVQVGGWKEVNINTANVEALVVDGGLGADTFNVSGTGGPALTIAGGQTPAADMLNLATVNANVTYGADPSSGAIDTGAGVVSFADIKTINLTGNTLGSLIVNGTSGNDAINQLNNQVTVNNGAVINFVGYASLALNGLAGNDQFNVNPTTLPAGLIFNVNGGTSTSGDSLVVNGSAAQDLIGFAPTGANAGSVAIGLSPAVSFTAIGNVSVNGQGGNDLLTVTTPAGADAITYTAGATVDASSVQVGSLVQMSFTNLGASGRVTLADTSGNPVDSLLYNGTAGNDSFGVNATGIVFLNSQLQVSIPGIASLTLDGQGGVNAFSVAGNVAIPVNVNGGSASAGNALTVLGDGSAPLTVDLGNHTVQEAGFGLISFNGLSQVNVDAAGQDVNVVGGAGDDNISYTPSGTDAGALQLAGLNTVFNLSAVGNLSVDPLGGTNSVTVNGNANQNTIDVVRGVNTSVQVDSLQSISIASADTQTIVVNSGLGDNTIDVSGSGGTALSVNGGSAAASDTLNVTAHGFTQVSFGGNSTSGTVATTDPQIAFSGIAVLGLTGDTNSSLSVFATNGNDAINLNENVVTVNAGTNVDFTNYPTLNLFGQNGDDVFNVWPTTLAGLTAVNIDGGDPTASDQLIVNGSSSVDTIGYNPTGADAGSVTIAGSPTVNFTTTESVVINGQGGNDALSVTTPAGADNITYTAGTTVDAAAVQVGSLAPMQFKNLGAAGSVTLADTSGGRVDTLVYSGTAANDTFTVAAGGAVTLNSQLAVSTPGISNLVLNGLNGDDTFNVTAPQPFASISLAGGDPSASDVVNLTGDGSAISLAIGGSTTTVTGGSLGIVMLTSDETLNLDAAGGAVTTTDSAGPNTLDITPAGASAATLQIEGQSPVVNLTNSGTFNANFTGAGDSLVVNGTSGPDLINASGSAVAVNALLAVNYAGATALTVNGSTGADTFNVTPDATVAIHVNGGDPIGVLPGDVLNIVAGGSPVSFFAGPHSDEGGFQVGSDAAVSFQQIESIGPIIGPGPVLILGTNGDDDIQVIARDSSYNALADGVQDYTVSVNAGPNILFINSPNLYIDALSGDDEVDVRAPAPNHAVWNTQVTIAGGAPAGQPGLNGDNFTLETPGAGNQVTYQPNATDGGVFTFSSSTITLTSAPFTIPAINYTSSAGGFESATYDGQGGNAALTIVGTTGNDTITHNAGAANDAGEVAVNSLLALSYKNLGATGSILVDGNGGVDTLAVDGTANNDTFTVDGTTGTVHLNNRVAIAQADVTNLVLNGYNPNNTFNLNASLPYETTTVNSIDPATLNLNGTPGAEAIGVDLANSQITGFGGVVSFVGVAAVNMNGNGGADSLTVNGTTNDDVITYKPTSSGGGTFSLAGMPVNFNFNIGAGNVFTVNGGGGNGGDEVDVLGNNAGSVITVDSPNRTVSVENALNVVLMPVVLGADVQVASVAGGIGNNTILVIPARNVPAGTDIVGPGFNMPNNLLVHVNGGAVPSNAALVVADTNGATLNSSLFAVVNRTSNTSGVVRLFQSTGGPEPIQYPDISYTNVGLVQASTAVNTATHQQQTLTMGPDTSDPNGSLNNAAYLGSGASINATNLTIFPNAFEHRFLQAEQDWFRVVAQYTGTMDFQVYFKQYAGFLPGGGELQIQVYDAAGNQITAFGVNDTDSDQRRRIPVVAGETYYLQVYGITQDPNFTPADGFDPTNATVNAYNLSITNTPAPSPDSLGLNNIVAQGSINNAIAPTTTTFTASNAAVPPPPTQPLPPLSSIDGFYVGKYLEFTSGALIGQRQLVTAYVGATHTFTFASPFSAAPAVSDKFQIESNDTGRTQLDNVTRDNTPTIYIRLDAANTPTDGLLDLQGGGSTSQTPPNNTPILIPFWAGNAATPPNSPANNGSFRVAVYDNTNPQSPLFLGYANAVPGQQGVFQLQVTTPLSDGSHILAAKVEIDSPSAPSNKDLSSAATFQMVVDTQAPPVYFGSPTVANSGLLGSSDTGVNGQPATIVDRITADSTPTLYGAAEANAVVRLYSDTNNNGIVDNGDVFLGLTTAAPVDGTNQFPSGQWQITTNVDLNNPTLGFSLDGVRHLLVTAEDVAGNVSAPQALTIFLDTQGPTVKNVSVTGSPGFDLFAVKANTVSPTPLVNSLDITFNDQPIRVGPSFVYPAVNPILATTPGNYVLIGDATGRVVITSVTFSDSTASGTPGMSVATLHFAAPLPDDRYTLTISDNITDNAGNNLDGEFGPTFSSGNGKIGGQFLGRFTVDSRPELGTYSSGSVAIDLNGNFVFDPQNLDQTNRDTTFAMGFSTDRLFAGKLADSHGVVNGFDKLGAYGFLNGQWRWLLDLDGDGVIDPAKGDLSVVEPLALDAMPVAGNWTNSPTHADQIGLFDGKTWWLDMNGDHVIDATDIALGGELTGNMKGLPIVGDFDGDGRTDLGTFANGMFYFDLSSKDPGGKLTGNFNTTLNVQTDLPNNAGFAGVLARPVAADMNHDGITDIGLFVPGRTQNASPSTAEWYWLISNDPNGTNRITGTVNTLNHPFDPTPLGHDIYAQFGNQFALPIVGNFDPPGNGAAGGGTQSGGGNWIQNLYLDVLGRAASTDEIAYWTDQVNHGVTSSQIATLFLTSTEHRSQLINTLYQQYLGRQADQAGINYWIGIWNATGGPEAVQAGIIGSAEYYQTAGGTDAAWVTALYQNILGRTVDAQGLAYWTDYIKTHTKQSVVMGFVTSDEYRLSLINGWFQVYLGRTLDASGAQYWLNQMKLGETQEQIQAGILGSTEFRNR